MREINLIVIHCSATREDRCFTEHDLEECHRRRGFEGAGYHFYIRKDGKIITTRGPCQGIQRTLHRHLLRRRAGLQRTPQRHPDRMAKTFDAGTGESITEGVSRKQAVRTQGSESGPERKRRDRTRRVDQGMPVL